MGSSFKAFITAFVWLGLSLTLVSGLKAQDTIIMKDGGVRSGDVYKVTELKVYWISDEGDSLNSVADNIHHLKIDGVKIEMKPRQDLLKEAFIYRYNSQNNERIWSAQKKNFVRFNMFNLLIRNIDLSYERRLFKGIVGIRIPLYYGFAVSDLNDFIRYKNYSSGIDLNFYPLKSNDVALFGGLGIEHGEMRTRGVNEFLPPNMTDENNFTRVVPFLAITANAGLNINLKNNFTLAMELDLGTRVETFGEVGQFLRLGRNQFTREPYGRFCVGLGYEF
jgi:hypothetical protein